MIIISRLILIVNTCLTIDEGQKMIPFKLDFKFAVNLIMCNKGKYPFKFQKMSSILIVCHSAAIGYCSTISYTQGAQLQMP